MAITFPRMMPRAGASSQYFEPEWVDYAAPEAGGRFGSVSAGAPRWTMSVTLTNMLVDDADLWRAWAASQRGAQRQFLGYDLDRPFPRKYASGFDGMTRAGGGAFSGAASSWSEAIDGAQNSVVTLTGLPADLALSTGDYIGFKWDAAGDTAGSYRRRALVRAVESATANGSGAVSITAEPPVPLVVPAGAVAHLDNPACLMRLLSETKLGEQAIGYMAAGSTIKAMQELLA